MNVVFNTFSMRFEKGDCGVQKWKSKKIKKFFVSTSWNIFPTIWE